VARGVLGAGPWREEAQPEGGPELGRPGAVGGRQLHGPAVGLGGRARVAAGGQQVAAEAVQLGQVVERAGGPGQGDRLLDGGQAVAAVSGRPQGVAEQAQVEGVVELGPGGQVGGQPAAEPADAAAVPAGGGLGPAAEDVRLGGPDREPVLAGGDRGPLGPAQGLGRLVPVVVQVGQLDLGAGEAVGVGLGQVPGLVGVGQGAVGAAQEPQGQRRPVVAGDGRVLAVGGQVGASRSSS
jgi:hypothetical protein